MIRYTTVYNLFAAIIPSVVLFTFANGGGTIIQTVISVTVFKEKFTLKSPVGIILGLAAFITIKL